MSTLSTTPMAAATRVQRGPTFLPVLFILFLGSGCAALIYEIVWFQLLQFAIGSSAVSIGVLLGTFMGGMCLGSLLFSRFVSSTRHPLRTYAFLELGIGVLGLLISAGLPMFDRLYAGMAHGAGAGIGMRAVIAVICLLPPTLLMGATLPAISRWIESTPRGVSWLGFFYGGNTVGAVLGCLLAGFYLFRTFDMFTASLVAVGINVVVAVIGIMLSMGVPYSAAEPTADKPRDAEDGADAPGSLGTAMTYVAIGFSGMTALGAEVVWTRLLSLLLGGTVYTFSIILAVFLVGLGIGSSVGAMIGRTVNNARVALGWCQILCAMSVGWAAWAVSNGLPNWPVNPYFDTGLSAHFQVDLARCAWAILPPTLLWGASFPLALAAILGSGKAVRDPAKYVGRVYAANTVGAIVGALFFSLIAIKAWGTQTSEHILVALAGLGAVAALVPGLFVMRDDRSVQTDAAAMRRVLVAAVALLFALAIPLGTIGVLNSYDLDKTPWQLVAWGRRFRAWDLNEVNDERANDDTRLVYMREGLTSSVAVTRSGTNTLNFHVAGKIEASTLPQDMRLQLMLGHFPALFHPHPEDLDKKVLIVGCGAGVTAGSFILHPDYKKIVICEIEPLVPQVVATYFSTENNSVVTVMKSGPRAGEFVDSRVNVVYDDGRHYILTTDEKYDVITSDPIHPWVKGAATLYTKEYFDLVKQHLKPGGLVTQWVPLYESNTAVVKSEIKTFFETFPNGTIWANDAAGAGYDVILMGSVEPLVIDAGELKSRMNVVVSGLLGDVQFGTPAAILKSYAGRATDLQEWMRDGQINSDRNLRLQYLAGEALNEKQEGAIQNEFIHYRRYPEDLIKAPEDIQKTLKTAWNIQP